MIKMPYTAKPIKTISNKPAWDTQVIGVFRLIEGEREVKIGEYTRNYHHLYKTFYPFCLNGKDYALYSTDYTATRVMSLPDCKDLGGEKRDGHGFCPVEFYVPHYIQRRFKDEGIRDHLIWDFEPDQEIWEKAEIVQPLRAVPFGFVAGCIWGDDTSWKIQYLDLSKVHEGVLKRDERFGYIELPHNQSLREAIDMEGYEGDKRDMIRINTMNYYHVDTGENTEREREIAYRVKEELKKRGIK